MEIVIASQPWWNVGVYVAKRKRNPSISVIYLQSLVPAKHTYRDTTLILREVSAKSSYTVAAMEMLTGSQQWWSVGEYVANRKRNLSALYLQSLVPAKHIYQATTSILREVSVNSSYTVAAEEMVTGFQLKRSVNKLVTRMKVIPHRVASLHTHTYIVFGLYVMYVFLRCQYL